MTESGAKLYGSEASLELLDLAVQNLEESGLNVVVKETKDMRASDYRDENKKKDRICLLVDDVTNSNIKGNFTYAATVLQQLASDSITTTRLWQQSAYRDGIPQTMITQQSHVLFYEELMRVLGRILPQGRKYLSVDYVVKNELALEVMGKMPLARGFKLVGDPEFVLAPEVYSDSHELHTNGGYHLMQLQKL